jgi:hypothetical protein
MASQNQRLLFQFQRACEDVIVHGDSNLTETVRHRDRLGGQIRSMMSHSLRRMWVDQPSTLQHAHKYHGAHVLVVEEELAREKIVQVWFASGDVISTMMDRIALSNGWPTKSNIVTSEACDEGGLQR